MSVTIRLPRVLADVANASRLLDADGTTVEESLHNLFETNPGLRNHLLDESGGIRPHVSVFVDGEQGALDTAVNEGSDIVVLQAVSGG